VAREPDLTNYFGTDTLLVSDVQGNYTFNNGLEAYFGVNNLTKQEPDPTYLNLPVGPRGRVFYLGLNANFSSLTSLNPFR